MLHISATFNFPVRVNSATANNSERDNLFATLRDSLAKLETDGSAFTLQLDNTYCLHVSTPDPVPEPTPTTGLWFDGFTDDELRAAKNIDVPWRDLSERMRSLVARGPRHLMWVTLANGWKELKITHFKDDNIYRLCKFDVNCALRRIPASITRTETPEEEPPKATQPPKAEVVIPEGWRKVTRGHSHKGDQELVADGSFEYITGDNAGWKVSCYPVLIRKIKAKPEAKVIHKPANTQSHLFLENGVVLVPRKTKKPGMCDGCFGNTHIRSIECNRVCCNATERADDREVIWVDSKKRWNKKGYIVPK